MPVFVPTVYSHVDSDYQFSAYYIVGNTYHYGNEG